MPELAKLWTEDKHKDQSTQHIGVQATDMKGNGSSNNTKDKSGSGPVATSALLPTTATATSATTSPAFHGASLNNKPSVKSQQAEEAEEGEVMEDDIEEGELADDDDKGVADKTFTSTSSLDKNQENNQDIDQDMKEATPVETVVEEEASTAMSTEKQEKQRHISDEINEDDLNGALLDGALDDYDDLDQDTEDTEVGNGDQDFSDDDDDDDDDDEELLDRQLMSDKLAGQDVEMHTPNGTAVAGEKAEERDTDAHDENDEDEGTESVADHTHEKDASPVHSEDSDSDPDPDPSDIEDGEANEDAHEEGEEDEEDEEEDDHVDEDEDAEDEEEQPPKKATMSTKKDVVFPQKPTLNRSQATEEELKDSGDELSDLSEFDDTDDSDDDEDDLAAESKSLEGKESENASGAAPGLVPAVATIAQGTPSTAKATAGGRKKSLQASNPDEKQETPKNKPATTATATTVVTSSSSLSLSSPTTASSISEQKSEHPPEIPNGRARLIEPAGRKRTASSNAETNHSDKDSGSEAADENEEDEEEEEEEEEAPVETPAQGDEDEEGGEEDDDLETKQMHKEALDALTSIEVEFASLRDKMYEERMMELDKEVEMINNGTHPELSSLMQEIAQKRENRLQIAEAGKRYKTDIAQSQYEVTEYLVHCTFQSARRNARSDLARELGSKQRQLILELARSTDTQKRKVLAEKTVILRARKHRRMEVAELKAIADSHAFPTCSKLTTVTSTELEDDFSAMGLARLLPPPPPPQAQIPPQPQYIPMEQEQYGHRPMQGSAPPATSMVYGHGIPPLAHPHPPRGAPVHGHHGSNSRWPDAPDYAPPHHHSVMAPPPSGRYYDSRPEVEIYVDGSRCMVDGIWYKPQDPVVVLDAAIGKYNAKYLFLINDEIVLQRTDGSKTKLHLGLFRGRKLYMQPRA
ncbi:Transcriptional regulatory protein [Podila humilis]|nr:Transcriptional regulatory protein [Podila humilis]